MPFDRATLLDHLPAWERAGTSPLGGPLTDYLMHYGLLTLAQRSAYRIGRSGCEQGATCIQRFGPLGATKGTVVVLHGYMDHMGLYGPLAALLFEAGWDTVLYDLAGHGLSAGSPLSVEDFGEYAAQLDHLLDLLNLDADRPLVLIGQSTGAGIIVAHQLAHAASSQILVNHRILLAPLIRPTMWRSIRRRFHLLKHFTPRVPRIYTANSHNAAFLRFTRTEDPLQHSEIPLQWIAAMLAWGEQAETALAQPDLPVTCIQGMADRTVDWHHNLQVLTAIYPALSVELVEGARHHLVNESDPFRRPVFERITQTLSAISAG